jgi:hypothetical protein
MRSSHLVAAYGSRPELEALRNGRVEDELVCDLLHDGHLEAEEGKGDGQEQERV